MKSSSPESVIRPAPLRPIVVCAALLAVLLVGGDVTAQPPSVLRAEYDTQGRAVLEAFIPVVAEAAGSVVSIMVDGSAVALGTVVGADGLILTKASELEPLVQAEDQPGQGQGQEDLEAEQGEAPDVEHVVTVGLPDGRVLVAERLATDRRVDLALLRVAADELRPVVFDERAELRLGQWVVVPGLDTLPEAVGVLSVLPRQIAGVRLGVSLWDTDAGPMVTFALPGMGAEAAGVKPGDIVVSLRDQPVADSAAIIAVVQDLNAGDRVVMKVLREGQPLSFDIELRLRELSKESRIDRMNSMGNDLSRRRDGFVSVLQHDAGIAPNQCGGPLLDLEGRCIGVNIARAGRVESYALPASVVAEHLATLKAEAEGRGTAKPMPVGGERVGPGVER